MTTMKSNGRPLPLQTPPGHIIEDEEEFLNDVEAYMKKRGVPFSRDGSVSGRAAPLHKLFKMVMEKGGYDAVTAGKMAWRGIAKNFNFPPVHEGAISYQLKMLYYKNLAAYEIEKIWHETPPAPDILERLTAKGGDLRRRTRESLAGIHTNEEDKSHTASDPMLLTPKIEKSALDEPESAGRYPSRLRQQPTRTQIYQPDPTPPRSTRIRTTHSPQPAVAIPGPVFANASSNPLDPSFKIDNYEPRAAVVMSLRPVMTPAGGNAEVFYQRKAAKKLVPSSRAPLPQDLLKYSLQKPLLDGPNIYIRCVQGLRSCIPREQAFALHHLVKVSTERGDKFKLEQFPTLGEALMEKILEITQLAFGVTFQVSYGDVRGIATQDTLDAVHGTQGLRQTMANLRPVSTESGVFTEGYITQLERLNEATLVIRNMVTLEDNSYNVSRTALFRDLLIVLLNLPRQAQFDEIRQYALDMAEMTTRYYDMGPEDDLYTSLVQALDTEDRGQLIPALRAIYRFDAEADRIHYIVGLQHATIQKLVQYCVLDDDELVEAVINFLYAWTAYHENLTWLLKNDPLLLANSMLTFSNLLIRGAITYIRTEPDRQAPPVAPTPLFEASIPQIPPDLHNQLLQFAEPDRSSRWIRCCFEEAPDADVTQIQIWQAYSNRFSANNPIVAADFIKNVSNTLSGAQAQVTAGPQGPRFIIQGIRPRKVLVNLQGQAYYKCMWVSTTNGPTNPPRINLCSTWHATPMALWQHSFEHLGISVPADGKLQSTAVTVPDGGFRCEWLGCRRSHPLDSLRALGTHLRFHVPDDEEQSKQVIYSTYGAPPKDVERRIIKHEFYDTAMDEKGHPCGIPFMSCLLMCNLARYVGRYGGNDDERKALMGMTFPVPVRNNLHMIFSKQRTIAGLIFNLIELIEQGEAPDKKDTKPHHDPDEMLF